MDDLEVIRELDELFIDNVNFNQIVKEKIKLTDNDVRVSFYKLFYHVIDATIHLIMFSKFGYSNRSILEPLYERSRTKNRFKRYRSEDKLLEEGYKNTYQFIAYVYFISIFNIFENSFRLLSQFYDPKEYRVRITSFDWMFSHFIKRFKVEYPPLNKINTDFFDFLITIRNSMHNNGKYVATDKQNSPKTVTDFEGNIITFTNYQIISIEDVWENNIKMTKKLSSLYAELILVPKIKNEKLIEDISAF